MCQCHLHYVYLLDSRISKLHILESRGYWLSSVKMAHFIKFFSLILLQFQKCRAFQSKQSRPLYITPIVGIKFTTRILKKNIYGISGGPCGRVKTHRSKIFRRPFPKSLHLRHWVESNTLRKLEVARFLEKSAHSCIAHSYYTNRRGWE